MATEVVNQPHDMEMEVSDSESVEGDQSHAHGDDEEFAFGDEYSSRDDSSPVKGGKPKAPMIKQVQNQPFDAKVELDDEESVEGTPGKDVSDRSGDSDASPPQTRTQQKQQPQPQSQPQQQRQQGNGGSGQNRQTQAQHLQPQKQKPQPQDDDKSEDEEEDEEEESSEEEEDAVSTHGYNAADYAHLKVSPEIKELFDYITRFKPQTIELETKMKAFVPDYIPAVGDIDAFLKIPRPDRINDKALDPLGITVLDEPGPLQTDPAVLDLIIRQSIKTTTVHATAVSSIENARGNSKAVSTWIQNINAIHKDKPAPTVAYTRPMPDIELLMQVWPLHVEDALNELQLPTAELDVDVNAYARIVCALLDIPVHNNLTESLHVLFTLYLEFKDNQHFNESAAPTAAGPGGMFPTERGY